MPILGVCRKCREDDESEPSSYEDDERLEGAIKQHVVLMGHLHGDWETFNEDMVAVSVVWDSNTFIKVVDDHRPYANCQFCMGDLEDEGHKSWCPVINP